MSVCLSDVCKLTAKTLLATLYSYKVVKYLKNTFLKH